MNKKNLEALQAYHTHAVPQPTEVQRLWEQIRTLQQELDAIKEELRLLQGDL